MGIATVEATTTLRYIFPPLFRLLPTQYASHHGAKRAAVDAIIAMIDEHGAGGAAAGFCKRRCIWSTDDYERTCLLGKGGFGVVVKARHRATGKDFALKSLLRSLSPERNKKRCRVNHDLLREASLLAACRGHPSLVGFHGIARNPCTGECSLVLEHVGPSLSHVLRWRRPRPFTEEETRRAMRQLLSSAARMRERRIVHRDIKPENILVGDGGGVVKICDLGLAVSMNTKPPYGQEGTLWYKAPEMLLGRPDYDELVDAWSLGCVMAELLAGEAPFRGHDTIDQLLRISSVLGAPAGCTGCPGSASMPLAQHRGNRLRPEERLSPEGFLVLNGLLACDPGTRLLTAMALRCPWFTGTVDAPASFPAAQPARARHKDACSTTIPGADRRVACQ